MRQVSAMVFISLFLFSTSASARFSKSVVPADARTVRSITFGSGLEFQPESDQTELELPLFLDLSLSSRFAATIDWNLSAIHAVGEEWSVETGNVETRCTYTLLSDRRIRPSVSLLLGANWLTAQSERTRNLVLIPSVGVNLSHQFVKFLLEWESEYHFEHKGIHDLEVKAFGEYEVTATVDLLCELTVQQFFVKSVSTELEIPLLSLEESRTEYSIGIGSAFQMSRTLKIDGGITYHKDAIWQFLFGWELEFGGD